jgi:hypothetical protein
MIVLLFLRRLRHSRVQREWCGQSVRQCSLARMRHSAAQRQQQVHRSACLLLACCLLGETRPWAECCQVEEGQCDPGLSPSASSHCTSVKTNNPPHRGERGIYIIHYTLLLLLLPLWCRRISLHTRVMLHVLEPQPRPRASRCHFGLQDGTTTPRNAIDLMSASSAHHKAVVFGCQ